MHIQMCGEAQEKNRLRKKVRVDIWLHRGSAQSPFIFIMVMGVLTDKVKIFLNKDNMTEKIAGREGNDIH